MSASRLRTASVISALSILVGLGTAVRAERIYPPWLHDQGPPPVFPNLQADADDVIASYGCEGTELISLVTLTSAQADTLNSRYDGRLTGLLNLSGTCWHEGHIPASLPLDPVLLLTDEGEIPDGPRLRETLLGLGPRPATHVDPHAEFILCGGTPTQQGLAFLLLRQAGIDSVRLYAGGIRDWRRDPARPVVRIVDTDEMAAMLADVKGGGAPPRDFVLLDLRHFTDFAAGSLPGAVNLPSHLFNEGFDMQLARHWPRADPADTPLVIFCYGSDCIRSRAAATKAARLGWRHILWYHGGTEDWLASGHILTEPSPDAAY